MGILERGNQNYTIVEIIVSRNATTKSIALDVCNVCSLPAAAINSPYRLPSLLPPSTTTYPPPPNRPQATLTRTTCGAWRRRGSVVGAAASQRWPTGDRRWREVGVEESRTRECREHGARQLRRDRLECTTNAMTEILSQENVTVLEQCHVGFL